jgi:predicted nucleotidyltransferase
VRRTNMAPLESRLRSVQEIARRLPGLESLYMVGSVAKQAQTSGSDLDLVAVTRQLTSGKRYSRLLRLVTQGIDFNVVSSSLIARVEQGEPTPFAPLLATWRTDGVLIQGKDTLPEQIPAMDAHARGVFAFVVASWYLWQFVAERDSVRFIDAEYSRAFMAEQGAYMRAESMMDSRWHDLGERIASEASSTADPRAICGLIFEELGSRIGDLRFSRLDQRRYVKAKLLSQKRLSWRSLAYTTPVQERAVKALYLLYASGHGDLALIAGAPPTIRDLARVRRRRDAATVWNKVQRSVLQELQLILGSGEILIA